MDGPKPKVHADIMHTRLFNSIDTMRDNLLNLSEALEELLVAVDPQLKQEATSVVQNLLLKMKKD